MVPAALLQVVDGVVTHEVRAPSIGLLTFPTMILANTYAGFAQRSLVCDRTGIQSMTETSVGQSLCYIQREIFV
jgi:hypothetical protein